MMDIANGHNNMAENDLNDIVNHPKHYTSGSIECIDYINACKFDYLEGNIVKYVTRYRNKNGVEDLRKAEFYLRMLIERENNANNRNGDEA